MAQNDTHNFQDKSSWSSFGEVSRHWDSKRKYLSAKQSLKQIGQSWNLNTIMTISVSTTNWKKGIMVSDDMGIATYDEGRRNIANDSYINKAMTYNSSG